MAEFTEIALAATAFADALSFRDEALAEVERCGANQTLAEQRLGEAMEGLEIAETNLATATTVLQEATS